MSQYYHNSNGCGCGNGCGMPNCQCQMPCCAGPAGRPGPRGPMGLMGPAGLPGADGEPGPIGPIGATGNTGVTGPAGERGATGSAGATGPMGPTGLPGEAGIIGPTGPAASVIPFAISGYGGWQLSSDEYGDPYNVNFSGFGNESSGNIQLAAGDWDNKTITMGDNNYYGCAFIMPYDAVLKKVYVLFALQYELDNLAAGITLRPFVGLAVSTGTDLAYRIIPETITYADPYVGGTVLPKFTIRRGATLNLNMDIQEGTLVAIFAGMTSEGTEEMQYLNLGLSGGLYFD